jgi:hypothetical protein
MALSTEDRLEIHELYARYAHCFDAEDAEGYAAVFAPDGRFVRPGLPDLVGTQALVDFVHERHAATPGVSHHVSNLLVEETAGGVRGRAYVLVLRVVAGEPLILRNLGLYDDELVQVDEAWRFNTRTFTSWLEPAQLDRPFSFLDAAAAVA